MSIMRRLVPVAIIAMLTPTAAFRSVTPFAHTTPLVAAPALPDCAGCEAGISGSNGHYTASWSVGGDCASWDSCAMCLPTCNAGGALNGSWSEAVAYYDNNSCDTWACWAMSADHLASLKAASAVALAVAVDTARGQVRYNRARRAIQVYDCRGIVGANLPLPDELATQLARLLP